MIVLPAKITCEHHKCTTMTMVELRIANFVSFYADGSSCRNAIDCEDLRLPEGWLAHIYRWQGTGERELRTYCPKHAEQHKLEGREI